MTTLDHGPHDEGLSLIELIVAMVVGGIILVGLVSIFVNSWKTQEDVLSVSEATNRGQLVGSMIEKAVRNAYAVTDDPTTSMGVRVWTSLTPACQGFAIVDDGTGSDLTIVFDSADSGLPDSSTWTIWEPRVTLDAAGSSLSFDGDDTVSYSLLIDTESAPVRVEGEVSQRTHPDAGENPC